MKLRDYQKVAIEKSITALKEQGNTLLVAPTGSGKTVMLSHIINGIDANRTYVLVHRKEVSEQNSETFKTLFPEKPSVLISKKIEQNSIGLGSSFCMIQSMANAVKKKLVKHPPDLLVIDEAHRVRSASYDKVIMHFRKENPDMWILGLTATPKRGDGLGLGKLFTNIAETIQLEGLLDQGTLVTPIIKVVDDEDIASALEKMGGIAGTILPIDESIYTHWVAETKDKPRKTIGFTSIISHAKRLASLFKERGVKADYISGSMSPAQRRKVLLHYTHGDTQILFNTSILTEGFDHPETSCILLIRALSHKSTMIQMIGRGLRAAYDKKDCLVIDFGDSIKTYGTIGIVEGEGMKTKGGQSSEVSSNKQDEPPSENEQEDKDAKIAEFKLVVKELTKDSEVKKWYSVNNNVFIMAGFESYAVIRCVPAAIYYLWIASEKKEGALQRLDRLEDCMTIGENFVEGEESISYPYALKTMQNIPASEGQLKCIPKEIKVDNKYEAMCHIKMSMNLEKIKEGFNICI